ncbi:DUF4041 domain-containing protein [Amycolatopsis magusensis]|uniref:Soluble cytochrome b562 n=1 Tax=Amycolatopsis magusensis TaxID=882444 RepID=A0ABS4PWD3_9PSEU|nr:DUF4041 domain-containing protein [Amycolatopsis magusensis]MBP2183742.1 soluble cytochrome b562 [Amycolatopsis magusensis]
MEYRFNPPPNWPNLPAGWVPPPGWHPPAEWPAPPENWQLWVPGEAGQVPGLSRTPKPGEGSPGLFGARKRLRQAEVELATAHSRNHELSGAAQVADRRADGLAHRLKEALAHNETLAGQVRDLDSSYRTLRGKDALTLEQELNDMRQALGQLEGEIRRRRVTEERQQAEAAEQLAGVSQKIEQARATLEQVRGEIVETEDLALLQEAGIYEYRHRLANAVAYKAALQKLRDAIKVAARNNNAITASTNWTVNNSSVEGQKMVRDFSKLMLRAYNTEADNCVRSMRPFRLESAKDRLDKTRNIISRLGRTMNINIADRYHRLRVKELELTADHLAKAEEEKERIRAERERQRDEQQAMREFEREKARLGKEQTQWQTAMRKWVDAGDDVKASEAQVKLAEIGEAIKGVEEREANVRTGWVYVISNIGSFGNGVVKVGLTRRLDPLERVRELGDASVPFRFDVHAVIFDADAVSLEAKLHQRLKDQRVNRVNLRREFFYASPLELLAILEEMGLRDNLVEYVQEPEAAEWRSSRRLAEKRETSQPLSALTSH